MTNTNDDRTPLEIWQAANPSLYPGQELKHPEPFEFPKELTVGELVAELLKLPQDKPVFRSDSEYGPEAVTGVAVEPAATYPGYPEGRVYEVPERIVIS